MSELLRQSDEHMIRTAVIAGTVLAGFLAAVGLTATEMYGYTDFF